MWLNVNSFRGIKNQVDALINLEVIVRWWEMHENSEVIQRVVEGASHTKAAWLDAK